MTTPAGRSADSDHEIHAYMRRVENDLRTDYETIRKRAPGDPGTAGDRAEESFKQLLEEWLPSSYHVVTKGQILSESGEVSPQVDIVVLRPWYPRRLLETKLHFAAGVAAAFECKLTLKKHHIAEAFEKAKKIATMFPAETGTPRRELSSGVPFGILAHSHNWTKDDSESAAATVSDHIWDEVANASHPRELLDSICIADLGYWYCQRKLDLVPSVDVDKVLDREVTTGFVRVVPVEDVGLETKVPTSALGNMWCDTLRRLAHSEPPLQSWVRYLMRAGLFQGGHGRARIWEANDVLHPRTVAMTGMAIHGRDWSTSDVLF